MLKLENVRKVFNPGTVNEKIALKELSLQLHPGDFVTVIGGNGAGKSKSSLNNWKFMLHVLSKPGLENFEHYFPSV